MLPVSLKGLSNPPPGSRPALQLPCPRKEKSRVSPSVLTSAAPGGCSVPPGCGVQSGPSARGAVSYPLGGGAWPVQPAAGPGSQWGWRVGLGAAGCQACTQGRIEQAAPRGLAWSQDCTAAKEGKVLWGRK